MSNVMRYWLNSDLPFMVIRQIDSIQFECFDRKTLTWKPSTSAYNQVLINNECHSISSEEAERIIRLLEGTDTSGMSYKDLCSLVKRKQ